MFGFRKETGIFQKVMSCLTNCDKILNFVTITLGYQSLTGHPTDFVDFLPNVLLFVVNDKSAYFGTLTELSD